MRQKCSLSLEYPIAPVLNEPSAAKHLSFYRIGSSSSSSKNDKTFCKVSFVQHICFRRRFLKVCFSKRLFFRVLKMLNKRHFSRAKQFFCPRTQRKLLSFFKSAYIYFRAGINYLPLSVSYLDEFFKNHFC